MITSNVLRQTAWDFSCHVYTERQAKRKRDISEFAIQLIRKYLPPQLIKSIEESPQTLVTTDEVSFTNELNKIRAKIDKGVYPRFKEIRINSEDFEHLSNLINQGHKLNVDRKNMETRVYTILKTLKTYNLIISYFPEIKPYLTPKIIPMENRTYRSNNDNDMSSVIPILNSVRKDIKNK